MYCTPPNRGVDRPLLAGSGLRRRYDGSKEQKVTIEKYEQISSSSVLLDTGWTAAIGLGLGLLTMLFPKPVVAQQHQFIAWMSAEMAETPEDAQIKMRDMTATAFEAVLKEL